MIYIIGAIIWAISIVVILRFFYVCNCDEHIPRDSELNNRINANSPYNDGWTREFYKDES